MSLNVEGRRRGVRRWRLFAGVFLVYLGYAVPDLLQHHSVPTIAAGLVLIASFVGLYLGPLPLGMFGRNRRAARWVPLGMTAITVAYLLVAGRGGLILTTYLCIAFVVLLRPVVSAPLVTVLGAGVVVLPQFVASWDLHGLQWGLGASALLTSLAMYGVRSSAVSQIALYQAHAEVEWLAAEQERLRIARDLHDLLGHALTTVTLKAELASRLATREPERAAAEMAEVAVLARQGLADVRAAVAGYRAVSLVTELAAAREVLRAAGISAELPAAVETVPSELRELFGWVVREGVTNVVRHADARHVRVVLGERCVEVEDDGRGGSEGAPAGSGLVGLRERVGAAGGRILVGNRPDGGWRLRVEVPA